MSEGLFPSPRRAEPAGSSLPARFARPRAARAEIPSQVELLTSRPIGLSVGRRGLDALEELGGETPHLVALHVYGDHVPAVFEHAGLDPRRPQAAPQQLQVGQRHAVIVAAME